ncbi:MAG: TonB family protein [Endomicrobia bacterium]|nr:TonB family protein [Endomicrobiia bacterium]MCX7941311.1 TonB family protein [Endomicrobiia bacterium]MDW8055957.1 TonB family protein [Elusimicrobiota bacterium]
MDSIRLRVSFLISCFLHFLLLSGLKFLPKHKPIVISFPVELINLPSEKTMIKDKVSPPLIKKDEIVIPKKKMEKPKIKVKQEQEQEKPTQPQDTQVSPQQATMPSLSLETAKFPFSYYVKQIREKIVNNWLWSRSYSGELKTIVYFRILRSGEIADLKVKESSNNKTYDNICLRAVETSKPFPPLPDGFKEDYLGVYFEFRYKD